MTDLAFVRRLARSRRSPVSPGRYGRLVGVDGTGTIIEQDGKRFSRPVLNLSPLPFPGEAVRL